MHFWEWKWTLFILPGTRSVNQHWPGKASIYGHPMPLKTWISSSLKWGQIMLSF